MLAEMPGIVPFGMIVRRTGPDCVGIGKQMTDGKTRRIARVLIANRGEIALRVIRACRELGIATVAIYGEGEQDALHVRAADDAYRITSERAIPYLDGDAIVAIAQRAGADAVHPGYGFLAENAAFAQAVEAAGIIFIGPRPETITAMGDKVEARRIAVAGGVSPVPGTTEPVASVEEAIAWAQEVDYPIAVKAAGGGGGRGFRVARSEAEMPAAFEGSRGEAERYFANPTVYLERYLEHPRHIEVQVFADAHGNVVAFPERDCSVQRRHQKLIEESPSPAVTPEIRAALREATERLASSVGYLGAGTVEYLLDADGSFYFLEMNTRIQVEHTVSEMVTGIDLVAEQIRVAEGQPLSFDRDLVATGWSIECRINAEDATKGFAPAPGTIATYREPAGFGVRIESGFAAGGTILPTYDSLIAKLVVWGRDRDEAIRRMQRALGDFTIGGVPTTIGFHQRVLAHEAFVGGGATTTFLDEHPDVLTIDAPTVEAVVAAPETTSSEVVIEVNGRRFDVRITAPETASASVKRPARASRAVNSRDRVAHHGNGNDVVSPVQGTIIRVGVTAGQGVQAGDLVAVVEAMKMENEITAHKAGGIGGLAATVGASVAAGAALATIVEAS